MLPPPAIFRTYKGADKFITFAILLSLLAFPIFAQDKEAKVSLGIGPEWNMNSREYFAGGLALSFDYALPHSLAVGLSVTTSTNFDDITVLEPAALFRWYFAKSHAGLFVQADLGAHLLLEDDIWDTLFDGGARIGFRIPLGNLYVEPFGRAGYPFLFGFGALAGIRF